MAHGAALHYGRFREFSPKMYLRTNLNYWYQDVKNQTKKNSSVVSILKVDALLYKVPSKSLLQMYTAFTCRIYNEILL